MTLIKERVHFHVDNNDDIYIQDKRSNNPTLQNLKACFFK